MNVVFVEGLGETGLLGQEDFFNKYVVEFQYPLERFWVSVETGCPTR